MKKLLIIALLIVGCEGILVEPEDACGVAGGDGSSCIYSVVQSDEQAIYSFSSITLDGVELTSNDWLIARNGDVLVGAIKYI